MHKIRVNRHTKTLRYAHVSFDGPAPAPTYKEQLEQKIAQKEKFIADWPNHSWLCDEAALYIKWAKEQLAKIEQAELPKTAPLHLPAV